MGIIRCDASDKDKVEESEVTEVEVINENVMIDTKE